MRNLACNYWCPTWSSRSMSINSTNNQWLRLSQFTHPYFHPSSLPPPLIPPPSPVRWFGPRPRLPQPVGEGWPIEEVPEGRHAAMPHAARRLLAEGGEAGRGGPQQVPLKLITPAKGSSWAKKRITLGETHCFWVNYTISPT